eukprot:COSAG04_NODE_550_length_12709_cov_6.177637_7_plen_471_part_00
MKKLSGSKKLTSPASVQSRFFEASKEEDSKGAAALTSVLWRVERGLAHAGRCREERDQLPRRRSVDGSVKCAKIVERQAALAGWPGGGDAPSREVVVVGRESEAARPKSARHRVCAVDRGPRPRVHRSAGLEPRDDDVVERAAERRRVIVRPRLYGQQLAEPERRGAAQHLHIQARELPRRVRLRDGVRGFGDVLGAEPVSAAQRVGRVERAVGRLVHHLHAAALELREGGDRGGGDGVPQMDATGCWGRPIHLLALDADRQVALAHAHRERPHLRGAAGVDLHGERAALRPRAAGLGQVVQPRRCRGGPVGLHELEAHRRRQRVRAILAAAVEVAPQLEQRAAPDNGAGEAVREHGAAPVAPQAQLHGAAGRAPRGAALAVLRALDVCRAGRAEREQRQRQRPHQLLHLQARRARRRPVRGLILRVVEKTAAGGCKRVATRGHEPLSFECRSSRAQTGRRLPAGNGRLR